MLPNGRDLFQFLAPTALEHFEGQRPFRGRGADELPRRDATNQRALFRSDRSDVPLSKAITARTWSALVLLREDHAFSYLVPKAQAETLVKTPRANCGMIQGNSSSSTGMPSRLSPRLC